LNSAPWFILGLLAMFLSLQSGDAVAHASTDYTYRTV
jgi:hypothetical protein